MPNPARRVFDPLPGQREFMEATESELLYSGSLGAGKTLVGLQKGLMLSQMFPGNEGLIVRKVAADLPSTALKDWREVVCPPELVVDENKTERWMKLQTPTGKTSRVWWTGMDRTERVGGTQFGWIFFDECVEAEEADWVWLEGRLRHPGVGFHQLMGATNPGPPAHFLYDRFITRGAEADPETGERLRRMVHANSLENPYLPREYKRRLGRFTGVHRDRFVLGKWVGYEGLVYGEFDPGTHIVKSFQVPAEWRRVASIDFGWSVPMSMSWYCQEPSTDTWFQYRQWYAIGTEPVQEGTRFADLNAGDALEVVLADHELSSRRVFEKYAGITTTPANKRDVDLGLTKVRSRLAKRDGVDGRSHVTTVPTPAGDLEFPSGAPGILFMEDALVEEDPALLAAEDKPPTRTTQEMAKYKWAKGAYGVTKDRPVKKDDHGCFPAGTLVRVPGGVQSIESITPGTQVETLLGPRSVIDAACTGIQSLCRLELQDGTHLVATGNHPVKTPNGYKRLDALRYGDTVWKYASTTGPTSSTPANDTSVAGPDSYTETPGLQTMGQSRRGTTSTTAMATDSTTIPPTSPVSHPRITALCTRKSPRNGWRPCVKTSMPSALLRRRGMRAQKGGNGMQSTPRASWPSNAPKSFPRLASTAKNNLKLRLLLQGGLSFVARTVKRQRAARRARTKNTESAPYVGRASQSTNTLGQRPVAVRVQGVCDLKRTAPVYNLTVEEAHHYAASDVWVSNCDELRYFIAYIDPDSLAGIIGIGGGKKPPPPKPEPVTVTSEDRLQRLRRQRGQTT